MSTGINKRNRLWVDINTDKISDAMIVTEDSVILNSTLVVEVLVPEYDCF